MALLFGHASLPCSWSFCYCISNSLCSHLLSGSWGFDVSWVEAGVGDVSWVEAGIGDVSWVEAGAGDVSWPEARVSGTGGWLQLLDGADRLSQSSMAAFFSWYFLLRLSFWSFLASSLMLALWSAFCFFQAALFSSFFFLVFGAM